MEAKLVLPYPTGISVNQCWKRGRWGVYLDPRVKDYRNEVIVACQHAPNFGKLKMSVEIECHFPDKRKRDLDNILKVVLDSMVKAKLFDDDSQIVGLNIWYAGICTGGKLVVTVKEHQ